MRRLFIGLFALALASCGSITTIAEFWRPISEPNLLMPLEKAQAKLNFDLSQCRCGIFPDNVAQADQVAFQPDQQRFVETGMTRSADVGEDDSNNSCVQRPSLMVAECMRGRGWEITNCSGRMPLAGGGAMCAGYVIDSDQ